MLVVTFIYFKISPEFDANFDTMRPLPERILLLNFFIYQHQRIHILPIFIN